MELQISIIIVNYNVYDDVLKCVRSIKESLHNISHEIIIVDNNSSDRSIRDINLVYKDVKLIFLDSNNGFGYANNIGMKQAEGKYLLLVNPDIIFIDATIEKLYEYLEENADTGVAGPIQTKPDEGLERYYPFFPSIYSRLAQEFGFYTVAPIMKSRFYDFWDSNILGGKPFKVDWVMGSCIMTRKEIFENTGGFEEAFFLYEEEVEWQYRMNKLGLFSMILPACNVLHNHHSSTSRLGILFVKYHEFRSRIIFSVKQYKFPLTIVRKFLTVSALLFRMFYYTIFNFRSLSISMKRLYLYFDLIKLSLSSKKDVLGSRFIFKSYERYFIGNHNAKL